MDEKLQLEVEDGLYWNRRLRYKMWIREIMDTEEEKASFKEYQDADKVYQDFMNWRHNNG